MPPSPTERPASITSPDCLKAALDAAMAKQPRIFTDRRDLDTERALLNLYKLQFKLLTTLGTPQVKRWLPGGQQEGAYYNIGSYSICTGASESVSGRQSGRVLRPDGTLASAMRPQAVPRSHRFGTVFLRRVDGGLVRLRKGLELVDLYCELEGFLSGEGNAGLADYFGISSLDLCRVPRIGKRWRWQEVSQPCPGERFDTLLESVLSFPSGDRQSSSDTVGKAYDRLGSTRLLLRILHFPDARRVEVPLTFWRRFDGTDAPVFPLHIPSRRLSILMPGTVDLPKFQGEGVFNRSKGGVVVLSDSLEVAEAVCRSNLCFSDGYPISWYGGLETVNRIDWGELRGRRVVYVICNHSGLSRAGAHKIATHVRKRLAERRVDVTVMDCYADIESGGVGDGHRWSWSNGVPRVLDGSCLSARSRKPHGSDREAEPAAPQIRLSRVQGPSGAFLLKPIMERGSVSLLHGGTPDERHWLALHLACSLAAGKRVFRRWEPVGPCPVLYIDGRMGPTRIGADLGKAASVFGEASWELIDGFLAILSQEIPRDLSNPEERRSVMRSLKGMPGADRGTGGALLVLDDLDSLVAGDAKRALPELRAWLGELKSEGVSVLVLLSDAGRSRTVPTFPGIDNRIELEPVEAYRRGLSFMARVAGRYRDIDRLVLAFDPSSPKPKWRVLTKARSDQDRKQRDEVVKELTAKGASNDFIADAIGQSEPTVRARKTALGISRGYGPAPLLSAKVLLGGKDITRNAVVRLVPKQLGIRDGRMVLKSDQQYRLVAHSPKEAETPYRSLPTELKADWRGERNAEVVVQELALPWQGGDPPISLCYIPPGKLDETPPDGLWLGRFPVLADEYATCMEVQGGDAKGRGLPVCGVFWHDACEFCRRLTELEREAGHLTVAYEYRLPTEAEWRYACGAGRPRHTQDPTVPAECSTAPRPPDPMKGKANEWGLYAMCGHVWQWCLGEANLAPSSVDLNSRQPARGGSWRVPPELCRASTRRMVPAYSTCPETGFRVALAPVPPDAMLLG
jgi:hypothetical protein